MAKSTGLAAGHKTADGVANKGKTRTKKLAFGGLGRAIKDMGGRMAPGGNTGVIGPGRPPAQSEAGQVFGGRGPMPPVRLPTGMGGPMSPPTQSQLSGGDKIGGGFLGGAPMPPVRLPAGMGGPGENVSPPPGVQGLAQAFQGNQALVQGLGNKPFGGNAAPPIGSQSPQAAMQGPQGLGQAFQGGPPPEQLSKLASNFRFPAGMKKGGAVKKMAKGGMTKMGKVASGGTRAKGEHSIQKKGHTRGKMIGMKKGG